jgi:hypothetical protein
VVVVRWFFFFFSILFCFKSSAGQVLLNEVYYDHPGRDDGYEFVELINTSESAQCLGEYRLEFHDGASSGWITIWRGQPEDTVAGSGELFLIGGDSLACSCDAISNLGLQNGPDAVRLVAPGGILDLLGYGSLDDPVYYEGRSATDAPSGRSLARVPDGDDTADNRGDFAVAEPSPGRFNVPRDDVTIRLDARTPARFVWFRVTTEVLAFDVINNGLKTARGQETVVLLDDSTRTGVRRLGSITNAVEIPPGDSIAVTFTVDLDPGYHFLLARVAYSPDERPGDNRLDITRRVGPPPLVVSEVMSYPVAGCPEYIELFNPAGEPYDLAGHWVRDAAHQPIRITADAGVVEPGHFAVLTPDSAALRARFPTLNGRVIEIGDAWPSLNHTGSGGEADSVVVLDRLLLAVDRISYPPQPSDTRGRSLERVDLYRSAGPAIWVLSNSAQGGSPGWRHSETLIEQPKGPSVRADPNPFDPWGFENLLVTIPDQGTPSRVVVAVFGVDGRRVRDIGSAAQLPTVMTWDGIDSEGRRVMPGIYIVACEFVSFGVKERCVEKVVVGCARKTKH